MERMPSHGRAVSPLANGDESAPPAAGGSAADAGHGAAYPAGEPRRPGAGRGRDADGRAPSGRSARTAVPRLSIVVPTKNEEANVAPLVDELERAVVGASVEIIFADDSSDGTPGAIRAVARRSRRSIRLVHRSPGERQGGLGGAVVAGIRAARAPWVCVMDGDLQHPPALIDRMVALATERGLDLVVASRYAERERVETFGALRSALSRASTAAAKLLFRGALSSVTDPMSGFFLLRRDAVRLDALRPRGFKILLEILVRTPGLRVGEVPFEFQDRHAGESKASAAEGMRYLLQLLELRFGQRLDRLARFAAVGGSGIAVNTAAFAFAASVIGLHYLAAAACATQVSTLWNYWLTDRWAFKGRQSTRSPAARIALFFALNNAALALRGPWLVLLVSGLAIDDVAANLITLVALTIVRFGVSDAWIWAGDAAAPAARSMHAYDIHGLVGVESAVRLPELEPFRVATLAGRPTVRVRLGKLSRRQSDLVAALAFMTRHTRYDEGLGRFGFGVEIAVGRTTEIVASPLLRFSPHVLYTNVVEPILRWTFVKRGYALAHGACIAFGDRAYLITARTDTGKTTTILKTLHEHRCAFLSDDLTLIGSDGRVLTYPKPLTISRHTVAAIRAPLRLGERLPLALQSRVHSRSGRRFALLLAKSHLPVATINALVQLLVPPPKYDVTRLVPGVAVATESRLAGFVVISRGGVGHAVLSTDEAVETLIANTDDAYGFPPYPFIEHFLHSGNGRDLRAEEREIVGQALAGVPAVLLRSETMDWSQRLPEVVDGDLARSRGAEVESAAAAPIPAVVAP